MKDIIARHSSGLLLFGGLIAALWASKEVMLQTAATIAAFEMIALWLSYFVLYVFSPVKWLAELVDEISKTTFERNKSRFIGSLVVVAVVVASVHILVGMCVFGIYFTRYSPIP